MGYFLKNAQTGELESDQELVAKADKLDWRAILSEQIPAYKQWVEEKDAKAKKKKDEEDSFSRWEDEI